MAVILIPFISSPPTNRILHMAVEEAGENGEVILLRVIPVTPLDTREHVEGEKMKARDAMNRVMERAASIIRDRNTPPVHISTLIREGEIPGVIASMASGVGADLIMMSRNDADIPIPFSSGTLSSGVGKATGIPLRIVS
ncbi:MAG: universal stress protein [Thermoplasmata archaeon]|nr:universal stress protein [Thermoplasmata archaeon]